jgi:hypothetical protein
MLSFLCLPARPPLGITNGGGINEMHIHRTTRDEAETTVTFNRHHGTAECCTADPVVARRWKLAGWPVRVLGKYPDGTARTWEATVPWRKAVRFATVSAGAAEAA